MTFKHVCKIGISVVLVCVISMVVLRYSSVISNTTESDKLCGNINNDTVNLVIVIHDDNSIEEYSCE